MADLGRGLLISWSQAKWDSLDAIAKQHFDAAVVFAKTWPPRLVSPDTPSVRIGGLDVQVEEQVSPHFLFTAGAHTEHDLEDQIVGAAARLALHEDAAIKTIFSETAAAAPMHYAANVAPFAQRKRSSKWGFRQAPRR